MRGKAEILLILSLALMVRLVFVHHWGSTLTLNSDDVGYINSAKLWLEKGVFTYVRPALTLSPEEIRPSAYITPGYPLFLAFFLKLAPESRALALARYAQVLLSVASVFFVYRLGSRWGKGELAAALAALYPPFILLSGLLLTETLFTFLLLLFLDQWLEARENSFRWFLLGLIGGLATLVRPTGVVLVGLALGGLAWEIWRRKQLFKALLLCLLGFCLVLSPWWVRNYLTFHRLIFLSTGGGNPLLLGTYVELEGIEHGWNPYWPVGRTPDETSALQQAYALKRLREGFSRQPKRYLYWYTWGKFKLLWGKVFLWGGEDKLPQTFTWWFHRALLLAGGTGLLLLLVRRAEGGGKILALLAAFTLVHLITCAYCRYALPLLPVLAACAAAWWPSLRASPAR
ncbi:glycosyltransferase family 39 protein [Ammonifex thiophilus]|nr:glycosyltransferase family 39 protein [Ammonifex thiophilus]